MTRTLTTLAAAATVAIAAVAAPAPAQARGGAIAAGVIGGLAAGAIIGGAAPAAPTTEPTHPPPAAGAVSEFGTATAIASAVSGFATKPRPS
jgi:hypothetical protein